jgi:DNA-binding response OmpR family regulator
VSSAPAEPTPKGWESGRADEDVAGSVAAEPAPLRLAILDEDSGFLLVLAKRVERLGWKHRVIAPSIPMRRLRAMPIDVLVVDPSVLGGRSWSWLERLFKGSPAFRVIVCTGASTVPERVRGLHMGADDWLTKPCHTEELVARIESVVGHRRREEPDASSPIVSGELEIRPDRYQAYVSGRSVGLTRREFEMIEFLAEAGNEPVEREVIYERLWGYPLLRSDRSVDVFVHKLRRKLADASPGWRYIHTHWGLGYRFAAEPAIVDLDLELALVGEVAPARLVAA